MRSQLKHGHHPLSQEGVDEYLLYTDYQRISELIHFLVYLKYFSIQ